MTFNVKDKLSQTIKNYTKEGNEYTIRYLDNTYTTYEAGKEEEKMILKEMLEQAKEREQSYNKQILLIQKNLIFAYSLVAAYTLGLTVNYDLLIPGVLDLVLLFITIKFSRDKNNQYKELKKYAIYMDIMDELDNKSIQYLLDDLNELYQCPLNINTLDNYSLSNLKMLKRKLKRN